MVKKTYYLNIFSACSHEVLTRLQAFAPCRLVSSWGATEWFWPKMLPGYFRQPIHFLASPACAEFANKSRQQLLNICGEYTQTYDDTYKSCRRSHKSRLLKRNFPLIWVRGRVPREFGRKINKQRSGQKQICEWSERAFRPPYKKDLVAEIYDLSLWVLTTKIITTNNEQQQHKPSLSLKKISWLSLLLLLLAF